MVFSYNIIIIIIIIIIINNNYLHGLWNPEDQCPIHNNPYPGPNQPNSSYW